ncbi:4909_t:CDS:2, partial [Racocetra persica]
NELFKILVHDFETAFVNRVTCQDALFRDGAVVRRFADGFRK